MPYKPKSPCGYPGCAELADGRYCEKHKRQVSSNYNRYTRDEDSKRFYGSKAWRRLAKMQLVRQPLCALCYSLGRITPAEIADHITPIKGGGARLDMSNLQSLCRGCHNKKHG